MDYFITYNSLDTEAVKQAQLINAALKSRGDNYTGANNRNGRLLEADYLIVIFNSEEDFLNADIKADWQFFSDEIRWKRKNGGQIIIYVPTDINFSRLPYKLKTCYYFNFGEHQELATFMVENKKASASGTNGGKPQNLGEISGKEIKYVPHDTAVKQFQYNQRAPSVDSFDGTINYEPRESEACKDDHVFGGGNPTKNHIEEELSRPTIISATASNFNKAPKSKQTSAGCIVTLVFLIVIGVIVGVVAATISSRLGAEVLPYNSVSNLSGEAINFNASGVLSALQSVFYIFIKI